MFQFSIVLIGAIPKRYRKPPPHLGTAAHVAAQVVLPVAERNGGWTHGFHVKISPVEQVGLATEKPCEMQLNTGQTGTTRKRSAPVQRRLIRRPGPGLP